ncbi:AMP-dependent synthetase, partial [Paraburkholderia steynii]
MNHNLAYMLINTARAYRDQVAIFHGADSLCSFSALDERSARCARGLREQLGLNAGDRVALVMKNSPQYVELLYGIWHAGLCTVPVNAKLHPCEIDHIMQ